MPEDLPPAPIGAAKAMAPSDQTKALPAEPVAEPAVSDAGSPPVPENLPAGSAVTSPSGALERPANAPKTGLLSWLSQLRWRGISRSTDSEPQSLPTEADKPDESSVDELIENAGLPNARDFNPLPSDGTEPASSSAEIFAEIGQQLRARREMLSLTHEEVERHTHVRTVFLAALERGTLDDLPSPVQTRGILANYAGFLDLDADGILLRFADGLQARYRERGPRQPPRTKAPMTVNTSLPPLRSFIASDLVFGGGVAIMLLLFAIWGISRVMAVRSQSLPAATPPSISDVLAGTLLPTLDQQVTVIPAQDTPSAPASEATATLEFATLDANAKVQVNLAASERTYMRVTVDGKVQFEGRTDLASNYSYQAENQVEILVGNAAAVRVNYNGRDLGLMGNFGEVIDRLYTAEGVATPTSTQPPTRTPTPIETPTPSMTPTVTPSVTRTPKAGG